MSDQPVRRISRFVRNHPWAITRDKLDAICEVIDARMRGVMLSEEEVQARLGAGIQRRETSVVNAVAVIPCYGVISRKMNMMTAISGGTSTEQFIGQVRQAVADETVKAVVIDADSPGGTVDGMIEAADALYELRGKGSKPIVAVANTCMASAAYWLLSQCDEIVGTPSALVGSIGIFCVHEDVSAANEKEGYKPTYIKAGEYKAEDNEDQPLSDDARAYMQAQVDARYGDFLKAIARGRGLSVATIKSDFGQGRALFAKDALAVKMIDRIATLDATISRFMGQSAGALRRGVASSSRSALRAGPLVAGVVPKDVSEKLAPKDTTWSALTLADFTDQPWDSLSTGEKRHIAGHFAWAASMPPESFGDLKLGHHRASDGAVVFRGVSNALARLDQTKLPAGDAGKVRAHLERHQAAFEKQDGKTGASVPLRPILADDQVEDDTVEDVMEPVDGECQDGYELGDDGLCHVVEPPTEDETEAQKRAAAADQDAIAIALALQK
jgi:signal peptide peptidase SppA